MRGQHEQNLGFYKVHRIIPARAGPTQRGHNRPLHCADHPRSCGANITRLYLAPYAYGSSPLVRGQRSNNHNCVRCCRIIPARAGPTCAQQRHVVEESDHPRSCGANARHCFRVFFTLGSSPLVRGQRRLRDWLRGWIWIIPARAGPTGYRDTPSHITTDHPRSCGAN